MKFVDKFALVPIERYKQLLKSVNDENEGAESIDQKGTGQGQKTLEEGLDTGEVVKEGFGGEVIKKGFGDKAVGESTEKKDRLVTKAPKRKFPPPPPGIPNKFKKIGIPNKAKKIDLKWLSLF